MPLNREELSPKEIKLLDDLIWIIGDGRYFKKDGTEKGRDENVLLAKNGLDSFRQDANSRVYPLFARVKTEKAKALLEELSALRDKMRDEDPELEELSALRDKMRAQNTEENVFGLYLQVLAANAKFIAFLKEHDGCLREDAITRTLSINFFRSEKTAGYTVNILKLQSKLLALGGFTPTSGSPFISEWSDAIHEKYNEAYGPEGRMITYLEKHIESLGKNYETLQQNLSQLRNLRMLNPEQYQAELLLEDQNSLVKQVTQDFEQIEDILPKIEQEHPEDATLMRTLMADILTRNNLFHILSSQSNLEVEMSSFRPGNQEDEEGPLEEPVPSPRETTLFDELIWIIGDDKYFQKDGTEGNRSKAAVDAKNFIDSLKQDVNNIAYNLTPNKKQKVKNLLTQLAQIREKLLDPQRKETVYDLYLQALIAINACLESMKFMGFNCENPLTYTFTLNITRKEKTVGLTASALNLQLSLLQLVPEFLPSMGAMLLNAVVQNVPDIENYMGPEGKLIGYLNGHPDFLTGVDFDKLQQNLCQLRNLRILNPQEYHAVYGNDLAEKVKKDLTIILRTSERRDPEQAKNVEALMEPITSGSNQYDVDYGSPSGSSPDSPR